MTDLNIGVIEGFYGRRWTDSQRQALLAFLGRRGFASYIYAPKSERRLRADWRQAWPDQELQALAALAASCRAQGLQFGLGLSLPGLQSAYTTADRHCLKQRLADLNSIGIDILCILFDDMPGAMQQLASRQLAVMDTVLAVSRAVRHAFCPTYYSLDPRLDAVFGERPRDYLPEVGRQLPAEVDVFWTGDKVISDHFSVEGIRQVTDILRRPPLLWDNYPVNDGRLTSDFLHLYPYSGRPWQLASLIRGHWVNPMNQSALSQLPLASLPLLYRQRGDYLPATAWQALLAELCSPAMSARLARDQPLFQHRGRSSLAADELAALAADYRQLDEPMAREVVAWLEGEYRFDPACLTD